MGSREYRAPHRDIGLSSNFARCRGTRRSRSCGGCGILGSVEKSLKVWSATSRQMRLILPWRFERPPFSRGSPEVSCDWSRSYLYWRFYFATKTDACYEPTGYIARRRHEILQSDFNSTEFSNPISFRVWNRFQNLNEIIFANPGNLAVFSAI